MNSVGLIGFGRFGKILSSILQKGFSVKVHDLNHNQDFGNIEFVSMNKVLEEDAIFIAVPIRNFEKVIKQIAPYLDKKTTILDVCSVKTFPVRTMHQLLPKSVGFIGTHPMFGPDSFLTNESLKMVMHKTNDLYKQYNFWKRFFSDQNIQIIEMNPEQHDRLAAQTQGITHFLGRMLKNYGIKKTSIDTQGFRDLLNLVDQTCNDSWDLYTDLQSYNPFTKDVISKLKISTNELDNQLRELKKYDLENK